MGACRSVQCGAPKPVYKTIINEIFKVALANNQNQSEIVSHPEIDTVKLENHVQANIKGLIDHLESNNNKLIDCGNYLNKIVKNTLNPEVFITCLFVFNSLIIESKKFKYDSNLLKRLKMQRNFSQIDESDQDNLNINNEKLPDDSIESALHLTENIVLFEDNLLEILIYMLDEVHNNYSKALKRNFL